MISSKKDRKIGMRRSAWALACVVGVTASLAAAQLAGIFAPSRVAVTVSAVAGPAGPGPTADGGRMAKLDAYFAVSLKPRASASETVKIYLDGALVGQKSLTIPAGASLSEMLVLSATAPIGSQPQAHLVQVIAGGTISSQQSWTLVF